MKTDIKKQPKKETKGKKQLSKKSKILLSTLVPLSAVFVTASVVTPIVINNKTFNFVYDKENKSYFSSTTINVKAKKTYTVRIVIKDEQKNAKILKFYDRSSGLTFNVVSMKINHVAQNTDTWLMAGDNKSCTFKQTFNANDYIEIYVQFENSANDVGSALVETQ